MDPLYVVILSMSTVMLLLCLVIFGIMLATKGKDKVYPTQHAPCPDGWPIFVKENDPNKTKQCVWVPPSTSGQYTRIEIEQLIKAFDPEDNLSEKDKDIMRKLIRQQPAAGQNHGDITSLNHILTSNMQNSNGDSMYNINTDVFGINFNHDDITTCDKKRWSNLHGIHWDGVSNFNNCSED